MFTADNSEFNQGDRNILNAALGRLMADVDGDDDMAATRNRVYGLFALIEAALIRIHERNPIHTVVMDPTDGHDLSLWIERELKARVVECVFEDWKADASGSGQAGQYKIISFYAKRARGLMARYAITHAVEDVEQLKDFGIAYEARALSAHRTPAELADAADAVSAMASRPSRWSVRARASSSPGSAPSGRTTTSCRDGSTSADATARVAPNENR